MRRAVTIALVACASAAAAQECPAGDLALGMPVSVVGTRGNATRITSGAHLTDGTRWNAPDAVTLDSRDAAIAIDLGRAWPVRSVDLQADNDDEYAVDASRDGRQWQPLAVAPRVNGAGLRTRTLVAAGVATARYLRVRVSAGDGHFAVARLSAYCQPPSAAVAPHRQLPGSEWWRWRALNDGDLVLIKGLVAFAALLVLGWGWHLRRTRQPRRHARALDLALAVLAALSFACWWNLGRFHYDSFVHTHEMFHYYLGAKYAPELGYTRLYHCALVAEAQHFPAEALQHRRVRDLVSRELTDAAPLIADADGCTRHFSPRRWDDFSRDVLFFRSQTSHAHWVDSMFTDFGFNGTPSWILLARPLASLSAASTRQIDALAAIDALLLVAMWIIIWWTFGWRVMCVALIFWGTNYPARYWWNGGAFLRMDWLVCCVAGVCALRRRRPFTAGALLGYAALLRVFPVAMIVAIAIGAATTALRRRSLAPLFRHRRLFLGVAAVVALLAPLSLLPAGRGAWTSFAQNSARHHASVMTNHIGVRTLLSFSVAGRAGATRDSASPDPWRRFRETHDRAFGQRRLVFVAMNLALLLLLARSGRRRPAWQMAILGLAWVPFATYLACYYYSFLLLYALLAADEDGFAPALAALSVLGCLAAACWAEHDDQFAFISLLIVVFTATAALWAAFATSRRQGRLLSLAPHTARALRVSSRSGHVDSRTRRVWQS